MSPLELDPRFTFDTFVVGAANRLATAAARRVADAPGETYNPLFIYSASGLGKTHLVTAIGHHARRVTPELHVVYDTLEQFMGDIMAAIEAGERDAFRSRVGDVGLLVPGDDDALVDL
ncbi:MAG: DnaA/Hda family protein, partial [Gemmatimonadota bacterium]